MYGNAEQIGQPIECPDCATLNVVPKPADKPARKRAEAAAVSQPQSASPAGQVELIPVVCPLCGTRMYATTDQIGQTMPCPDCETLATVPNVQPLPRNAVNRLRLSEQDEFSLSPPITPKYPTLDEWLGADAPRATHAETINHASPAVELPPELRGPNAQVRLLREFVPALAAMFQSATVNARGVVLVVLAVPIAWLTASALAASAGQSLADLPVWFSALIMAAMASCLAGFWLVISSASVLMIIENTALENRSFENWPDEPWIDWIGRVGYIVNAAALAAAPAGLIAFATGWGEWLAVASALSLFVLFPPLLLSMLEEGSCLWPISGVILRSFGTALRAWLSFYAVGALLAAISVGAVGFLVWVYGRYSMIPASFVLVVAMLIYSRLLGLLARACLCASAGFNAPNETVPVERT